MGDGHGPAGLHRDTPALLLNLLLAPGLGNLSHYGGDGASQYWASKASSKASEEQLRISLSIGLGLGVSLALHDRLRNESGVETKSADKRTNSGGWSQGSHWGEGSHLGNRSHWSNGSHNTSGLDHRNSGGNNTGVIDHSVAQLDLSVDLSLDLMAHVSHDVLALNITNINTDGIVLIPPGPTSSLKVVSGMT